MSICTQCIRALRRQGQAQSFTTVKALSTSIRRGQQASNQDQLPIPPPIPTTTPTAISNIAAEQTPSNNAAKKVDTSASLSTAQMQRQIKTGLSPVPLQERLAKSLRGVAKGATETYITYGVTQAMLNSCAAQAGYTIPEDQRQGLYTGQGPPVNSRQEHIGVPDANNKLSRGADSWWFKDIGLEPTFSVWSQVTFLHMYMLTVRMRDLPTNKEYLEHQKYLVEHFSADAEDRMNLWHGMGSSRTVRNKYLKDLFIQWRGAMYAYDEGLVKGDAVLAAAVWRNLWKADEEVDWQKVAMVVAYVRRCLTQLSDMSLQDITGELSESSQLWDRAQQGLSTIVDQPARGINDQLEV